MNALYKQLLSECIRFKSISTSSEYTSELEKMAQWLQETLAKNGFKVHLAHGYGNPVVIASLEIDPTFETCLIYGHYDVQPAEKSEGWNSEPFELFEDTQRIYARGVIDNKGQVLVHIATILELAQQYKLGYNIKFFIEGNEETGSPFLEKCIKDNKELLKTDLIMISDGEITAGNPILELGFRGGFNLTLEFRTAKNDLHSGIYGGAAPNAALELSKFLAKITTEDNKISVPGFYDEVEPIQDLKTLPFDEQQYLEVSGTKTIKTEKEYDVYTQVGLRPTLQITGIQTGYTSEGYRNSIPSTAKAKINGRLVKNQKPEQIIERFKEFLKNTVPEYVEYSLQVNDLHEGIKLNIQNTYIQKAEKLLEESYGTKPLQKYSGGGLPIVTHFENILNVPQILVPFANEDCAMHGVNENFELAHLEKALNFSKLFFQKVIKVD